MMTVTISARHHTGSFISVFLSFEILWTVRFSSCSEAAAAACWSSSARLRWSRNLQRPEAAMNKRVSHVSYSQHFGLDMQIQSRGCNPCSWVGRCHSAPSWPPQELPGGDSSKHKTLFSNGCDNKNKTVWMTNCRWTIMSTTSSVSLDLHLLRPWSDWSAFTSSPEKTGA